MRRKKYWFLQDQDITNGAGGGGGHNDSRASNAGWDCRNRDLRRWRQSGRQRQEVAPKVDLAYQDEYTKEMAWGDNFLESRHCGQGNGKEKGVTRESRWEP